MSCINILNIECPGDYRPELMAELLKLADQFPEHKKMFKLLAKKTELKEISFAGRGSFDEGGKFWPEELERGNKYKIVYFYPEVTEPNLHDPDDWYSRPKEFVWLFHPCKNLKQIEP